MNFKGPKTTVCLHRFLMVKPAVMYKYRNCAAIVQIRQLKIRKMLKYLVTRHAYFVDANVCASKLCRNFSPTSGPARWVSRVIRKAPP